MGCAHGADRARDVESPPPPPPEREVLAVESPPPEPVFDAPPARPKLTRTLTLGQGNDASTYQGAPTRTVGAPAGAAQGTVTNIYINNQASAFAAGGGYGGRGYGGYRGAPGGGYAGSPGSGSAGRGGSAWGASGWEGAGRTAGPGRTPGVGGNWSPAPSYGPAPMR